MLFTSTHMFPQECTVTVCPVILCVDADTLDRVLRLLTRISVFILLEFGGRLGAGLGYI